MDLLPDAVQLSVRLFMDQEMHLSELDPLGGESVWTLAKYLPCSFSCCKFWRRVLEGQDGAVQLVDLLGNLITMRAECFDVLARIIGGLDKVPRRLKIALRRHVS